ncbi:hypothetical protein WN943_014331 [Citrus x changshan-huyou]
MEERMGKIVEVIKYKDLDDYLSLIDGKCSPIEPKSPAMIRAEKVQSNLELQFPSFAKSMCNWRSGHGEFLQGLLFSVRAFAETSGMLSSDNVSVLK